MAGLDYCHARHVFRASSMPRLPTLRYLYRGLGSCRLNSGGAVCLIFAVKIHAEPRVTILRGTRVSFFGDSPLLTATVFSIKRSRNCRLYKEIVVRGGMLNSLRGISSHPITATDSGMESSASDKAASTANATSSL